MFEVRYKRTGMIPAGMQRVCLWSAFTQDVPVQ